MKIKLVIIALMVLIAIKAGATYAVPYAVPASQDVYLDLLDGTANDSETLTVSWLNSKDTFTGLAFISFDINGMNLSDDDFALLVLKSTLVNKKGSEAAFLTLYPIDSNWTEEDNFSTLLSILEPVAGKIKSGNITGDEVMRMDNDQWLFSFDVSKSVRNAVDGKVSYILVPMGNADYRVDFKSKETGEGPALLFIEYPDNLTVPKDDNENTSIVENETSKASNLSDNQSIQVESLPQILNVSTNSTAGTTSSPVVLGKSGDFSELKPEMQVQIGQSMAEAEHLDALTTMMRQSGSSSCI